MKFILVFLVLGITVLGIVLGHAHTDGHAHDHAHSHDGPNIQGSASSHQQYSNGHDHVHDHDHDHDHDHNHDHNHQNVHSQSSQPSAHNHVHGGERHSDSQGHVHQHGHGSQDEKYGPLINLELWTQDKQKLTFTSVIIVSLPSIPTFIVLQIVSKLFGAQSSGNLINNNLISKLIAFSFGTLIGDVFLHILPHLLEGHIHETHQAEAGHEPHSPDHNHTLEELRFYFYILGGILFFICFDYLAIKMYSGGHNHHDHDHGKKGDKKKVDAVKEDPKEVQTANDKSQVLVFLFGDFLHNFTDGIALGASYSYSIKIGLSTTIAILMHETPHEIGDFAYLIKKKYTLMGILSTQIFTSLGCMIGAFVGLYCGEIYKEELLSLTAGGFLYMCLSSIFPDIRQSFVETKGNFLHFFFTMCFIIAGIGIMYAVTFIE